MKTALALIVALTAGACSKTQPVTTAIHVEGMTCGSCEQAIQAEVKRLEGVQTVRASHREKKVWVTYLPDRLELKLAVQTINRLGYRASMPTARGAGELPRSVERSAPDVKTR